MVMLAATVVAVTAWQHVGYESEGGESGGSTSERDFMDRMEERWRRRHDEGL